MNLEQQKKVFMLPQERQRSDAQKLAFTLQNLEAWRYQEHLKRKALFEKGIVSIEKQGQTFYLKVKGWCVAVCVIPYDNLGKIIQTICDTILAMKREEDDAQKILQ